MPFTPASAASIFAFVGIVAGVLAAFLGAIAFAYRHHHPTRARLIAATLIYLILVGVVVETGVLTALPFSGLPFLFGLVLCVSLGTGLSPVGSRLAASVPIAALVAFQSFRLPLELVLHSWVEQGTIPETMTWTGQNWDIATGVVCLLVAPVAGRSRAAAWLANIIGSVLLLNVIRVAVLSSPLPIGWGAEPPLLLGLHLPYTYIGPVCVGGALVGHVVLTRALLTSARGTPADAAAARAA